MLNTFDFWKTNFENTSRKDEVSTRMPKPSSSEENLYECDQYVCEASTQGDLKEHKKDNHNWSEFKCDECGHTVLTENDLKGHKRAYHSVQQQSNANINKDAFYLCNDCDLECMTKEELQDHIKNEHTLKDDFTCDKCQYVGTSIVDLEHHRKSTHYYFLYLCGACEFETMNKDSLRNHKQNNHGTSIIQTKREKVTPPPRCNPKDVNHSSQCCDRDPRNKKPVIYSHEQRKSNGKCVDWNKGHCDDADLCKFAHVEMEECRFANFCSRSNCKFWHNIPGKYPFLEATKFPKGTN